MTLEHFEVGPAWRGRAPMKERRQAGSATSRLCGARVLACMLWEDQFYEDGVADCRSHRAAGSPG